MAYKGPEPDFQIQSRQIYQVFLIIIYSDSLFENSPNAAILPYHALLNPCRTPHCFHESFCFARSGR
jgi:hypothetical protein